MRFFLYSLHSTGWLISYSYPLLLAVAESGTCTQGSTDAYAASTFLCAAVLIFFVPAIQFTYRTCGKAWWLCLFHPVSLVCYGMVLPGYLHHTTLRGCSPCYGNEFWGGFSSIPSTGCVTAAMEDRLFAILFTLAIAVITFYSLKIIINRFSGHPSQ